MKILGLDVSTTSTGLALLDTEEKKIKTKLFTAKGSPQDRIKKIAKDIKAYIGDKEFDVLVISKASYATMNPHILMLEGILLGISLDRNIDFDYFGDSSWWAFLGDPRAERPEKKQKSLEFAIKLLGKTDQVDEFIIDKKGDTFKKISARLKDGTIIEDDISDAICAAYFYPKRLEKQDILFEKSETQLRLNELRKENTKLNKESTAINQKIYRKRQQIRHYESLYVLNGYKTNLNAIHKRKGDILDLEAQIIGIGYKIQDNRNEIELLMKKKNTLDEKKDNL